MKLIILVIFCFIHFGNCANILYLSNVASPSHFIWCKSLLYSLHERGHNITALSADIEESKPNLTYLHLDHVYSEIYNETEEELNFFEFGKLGAFELSMVYAFVSKLGCVGSLKSKGYQQLLDYPDNFKFDLALFDLTMDPCILGIYQKFKPAPPLIGLSAFHSPGQFGANLMYPAFVPQHMLSYTSQMSFQQRIVSTFSSLMEHFIRIFFCIPMLDRIVREKHPNIQYLGDVMDTPKLFLINNDPIVDFKQPVFANQRNVGGMQIKKPKELPEELKVIADGATDGVVYFSLGTNVRSDALDEEIMLKILKAFSRLNKYTFLWKFETKEKLPITLPKNVKIKDWMPQNDILAHKNTKLFISHCGLLSIQESLWYGVPILGFPVFADQPQNAVRIKELGVGENLKILDFTEDQLHDTIKAMLENPKYKTNVKKISKALHDKPMTALEEATYWTEWLLRNPDIDLVGGAADLNLFVRHSLDIYTLFLVAFIIVLYLMKKIVTCVVKCLFFRKKPKDLNKKKTN